MAFWSDPSSLFPKQSHRWVVFLDPFERDINAGIPHYLVKSVDRPSYKIDTVQAKYLYSHTFNFPKRLVWNPIKIEFYDVFWTDKRGSAADTTGGQYDEEKKVNVGANAELGTIEVKTGNSNRTSVAGGGIVDEARPSRSDPFGRTVRTPTNFQQIIKVNAKTTQKFFYDFLENSGYFNPNEEEIDDLKLNRFRSYHFKKNMITVLTGQKTSEDLLSNNSKDYRKDYIYLAELDGDGVVIEEWKLYNPLITDISNGKLDYASDSVLTMTVGITYDWAELTQLNRDVKPPKIQTPSTNE